MFTAFVVLLIAIVTLPSLHDVIVIRRAQRAIDGRTGR